MAACRECFDIDLDKIPNTFKVGQRMHLRFCSKNMTATAYLTIKIVEITKEGYLVTIDTYSLGFSDLRGIASMRMIVGPSDDGMNFRVQNDMHGGSHGIMLISDEELREQLSCENQRLIRAFFSSIVP